MDGAILALVAPMLMREFAIDLGTYRSGVQLSALISIIGLYLWPWLADRFGRRNILAINIAVFSLAMPLVALSPTWGSFVVAYSIVRFALNGEWAVGSMLVAETWPARLRGLVLSFDRSAWGDRRRPRRHHRDLRGDDLGVAGGLRAARDDRACWRSMSG